MFAANGATIVEVSQAMLRDLGQEWKGGATSCNGAGVVTDNKVNLHTAPTSLLAHWPTRS